jgi:uncharacterized membrane protein
LSDERIESLTLDNRLVWLHTAEFFIDGMYELQVVEALIITLRLPFVQRIWERFEEADVVYKVVHHYRAI